MGQTRWCNNLLRTIQLVGLWQVLWRVNNTKWKNKKAKPQEVQLIMFDSQFVNSDESGSYELKQHNTEALLCYYDLSHTQPKPPNDHTILDVFFLFEYKHDHISTFLLHYVLLVDILHKIPPHVYTTAIIWTATSLSRLTWGVHFVLWTLASGCITCNQSVTNVACICRNNSYSMYIAYYCAQTW